jgi:hypothetical protein
MAGVHNHIKLLLVEMRSWVLFAHAGLEQWSSRCPPLEYLGLQAWAIEPSWEDHSYTELLHMDGAMAKVIKHLPSKHKTLSSNNTAKKYLKKSNQRHTPTSTPTHPPTPTHTPTNAKPQSHSQGWLWALERIWWLPWIELDRPSLVMTMTRPLLCLVVQERQARGTCACAHILPP